MRVILALKGFAIIAVVGASAAAITLGLIWFVAYLISRRAKEG